MRHESGNAERGPDGADRRPASPHKGDASKGRTGCATKEKQPDEYTVETSAKLRLEKVDGPTPERLITP